MKYQCNVCGHADLQDLVTLTQIPVYCNTLFDSEEAAKSILKADLDIKYCNHCDHIFNGAFNADHIDYMANYDASLDYSPHFQKYAKKLAEKLISAHKLVNKTVIEIACGQGAFLNRLAEMADNRYVGYDPSFDNRIKLNPRVKIRAEYFGEKETTDKIDAADVEQGDLVICRHALEHIGQPRGMIKNIADSHHDRPSLDAYFEVPNALFLVRDLSIWDFIYEHVSYFSPRSLCYLFEMVGFSLNECYEAYDGQFLSLHASLGKDEKPGLDSSRLEGSLEFIQPLRQHFDKLISKWNYFFADSTQKTVIWGAGSKCITFLNIVENGNHIAAIVDLNPNKRGKFTAGTGHPIISPEQLRDLKPDNVIIMNPIYRDEIEHQLRDMGLNPEIYLV